MRSIMILPGKLSIENVIDFYQSPSSIVLSLDAKKNIEAGRKVVEKCLSNHQIIYGVNTGFGKFANTIIAPEKLIDIQYNLLRSHAVGTGEYLSEEIIRLIYLFKISELAQGYSGVSYALISHLMAYYEAGIFPLVPSKGSVGASGDLAPLAHFSLPLIGEGEVTFRGKACMAHLALKELGLVPYKLGPKEGLSLVNGLQVSLALIMQAYILIDRVWRAALYAGALSCVALGCQTTAFDERVVRLLNSPSALKVSQYLMKLIGSSHGAHVQDPYSLRCQPQVMGACLDTILHAKVILSAAINAVTDNPIVSIDDEEILSGGNFHGQNLALLADGLADVITTIGNISERRIAVLMEPHFSNLPAFLVENGGENSGLMMMQVTAAALASENKVFAHPASADTIPTSDNQEDHVSMSTFSARRLHDMLNNVANIVAIELICAAQAIDLRKNVKLTEPLEVAYHLIRDNVKFYDVDRIGSQDIQTISNLIKQGKFVLLNLA